MTSTKLTKQTINRTMSQSSKNAINILFLGETGAGKSTTLNALANYFKNGNDFKVSSLNELVEVIPTRFILPDPKTGAPITIGSSSHANERQKAGMSATIEPSSYMFDFEENIIRVIDTPGIGDTAGIEVDNENFDQILQHLEAHQMLNAIVFVVKNNDARATNFFRYCISQPLLHLHKSVSTNIIFCFTHSRSYMFGPGDGFRTLQAFLENDLKEDKLKLSQGKNCFFIDNDSYRILMAKRQGYSLDEDTELSCVASYRKSANQLEKMLHSIITLPPHNLMKTILLNQARNIARELIQPMIQMETKIMNESYNQFYTLKYELKNELIVTQTISAKFGYLLNENSYFSSNKVFGYFVQSQIDEEAKNNHSNVEPLKRLKKDHENRVGILTDSIKQNKDIPVHLEDIPLLKQQLFDLKHNGENFRRILETNEHIKKILRNLKRECKLL